MCSDNRACPSTNGPATMPASLNANRPCVTRWISLATPISPITCAASTALPQQPLSGYSVQGPEGTTSQDSELSKTGRDVQAVFDRNNQELPSPEGRPRTRLGTESKNSGYATGTWYRTHARAWPPQPPLKRPHCPTLRAGNSSIWTGHGPSGCATSNSWSDRPWPRMMNGARKF